MLIARPRDSREGWSAEQKIEGHCTHHTHDQSGMFLSQPPMPNVPSHGPARVGFELSR